MEVNVTSSDDNHHYGAISIDSNIFVNNGYKLKSGVLSQLKQFKGSDIKTIQSDIVHKECFSHISDYYEKQELQVKKAIGSIHRYSEKESDEINGCLDDLISLIEPNKKAEDKLISFYDDIGAEVIDSQEYVDLKSIIDMYFTSTPPFEKGEKKKYEFPDAIALRSLESWAERNGTKVLAVSDDKGWGEYAKTSDRIDVINDLPQALSTLLPQKELLGLVSKIKNNAILDYGEITEFFINDLHETNLYSLDLNCSSSFMFEVDDINAYVLRCTLDKDDDGNIKLIVLNIGDRKVRAVVMASMEVALDFNIDFQTIDPVDKDTISISNEMIYVETNYYADAIIDIYLPNEGEEPTKDNVDIKLVDIRSDLNSIYLGDLEPNFSK